MKISFIHQDVGCDHKIGSGAEEDICGVCKGNGTTCRTVEGRFNQLAGSGTVTSRSVYFRFKCSSIFVVFCLTLSPISHLAKYPQHLHVNEIYDNDDDDDDDDDIA